MIAQSDECRRSPTRPALPPSRISNQSIRRRIPRGTADPANWRRAVAITHRYVRIPPIRSGSGGQTLAESSCCIRQATRHRGYPHVIARANLHRFDHREKLSVSDAPRTRRPRPANGNRSARPWNRQHASELGARSRRPPPGPFPPPPIRTSTVPTNGYRERDEETGAPGVRSQETRAFARARTAAGPGSRVRKGQRCTLESAGTGPDASRPVMNVSVIRESGRRRPSRARRRLALTPKARPAT